MDEILVAFANNESCEEYIKRFTSKQLVTMLWKSLKTLDDSSILLNALLSGIKDDTKHQESCRFDLFMCGLQIMLERNATPDMCSKFVGVLLLEIERFETASLCSIFNKLLNFGESGDYSPGKWLELIPRVISSLTTRKNIPFLDTTINGEEFNAKAIELLLTTNWPSKIIVNIAAIFNDIALTPDQLKVVLMGLLNKMKTLPLDNVPPFVFQLHLLCTKGHKNIFLKELIRFFDETEQDLLTKENTFFIENEDMALEDCKITQLRQTEGTVLLHLLLAVKSDQDLGNEFVKWLKVHRLWPNDILASFTVSLAFCFANISRFRATIFETLKSAILQCFKETIARKSSFWMRKVIAKDFSINDVMESITKSVTGCDHVIQSLIEFGFYLLDSFSSINPQIKFHKESLSTKQKTCSLGCHIILNTFKNNRIPSVREEIINSILKSIVPSDSNVNGHYMKLLKETIRISPQDYHQSSSRVCELFDYLVWLPTSVATELIFAVQPLIPLNLALRDLVLLTLRKSMTHKEISARKIAVNGSLICLKHFRNSDHLRVSSQSVPSSFSESQQQLVSIHHSEGNLLSSNVLSLELVAMLRRCFCLQADLRMKLYMGFSFILKQNGFLVDTVLDMLLCQINKVVEAGAIPPIRFKKCVQMQGIDVVYMEPLHLLLRCTSSCLIIAKAKHLSSGESQQLDDSINSFNHPLVAFLKDFRSALSKIEIENYELEQYVEYTPTSFSGSKNTFFAKLILGVYEALIEYTFFSDGFTSSMVELIIDLYAKYKDLLGVIKKAPAQAKNKKEDLRGEKNEKLTIKPEKHAIQEHIFSAQFLISVLKLLISDSTPDHQESAILLKRQTDFISLVVTVTDKKIANILECGCVEIDDEMNVDDPFNFCCSVGRLMLQKLDENDDTPKSSNEILLEIKFLECLSSIFNVVTCRYFEKWKIFINHLASEKLNKKLDDGIYEQSLADVLKKLQRMVNDCLSDSEDRNKIKQLGILITILSHLVDNSEGLSNSQEFLEWIKNLCSLHSVDDTGTAKQIFNLYLKITSQYASHLQSMVDASADIHSRMINLDETNGSETESNYSLITENNSMAVFLTVTQHLDSFISNLEWVISKMKVKTDNEISQTLEPRLCSAFVKVTVCEFNLISCNLPPGQCVDTIIKSLSHFYLVLQELIKYLTIMFKNSDYKLGGNYIKFIEQINLKLTPRVYTLLESQQQKEENAKGKKEENAKGKKKVNTVKESVTLPTLIYNLEQFERFLIKLSKVSKVNNLIANMKRSTNRDFRIDLAQVDEIMELDEATQPDLEENLTNSDRQIAISQNGVPDDGTQGPPRKCLKLSRLRGSRKKKL